MFKSFISRRMSVRSSSVRAGSIFIFFFTCIKQFHQLLVKDRQVKLVVCGGVLDKKFHKPVFVVWSDSLFEFARAATE